MDELHQLHEAITKLWQIIKKYNSSIDYEGFIEEVEGIRFENKDIENLFQNWIVKYMNYIDAKGKNNGNL